MSDDLKYQIRIHRNAQKELARIKGVDYDRLKCAIYSLAVNPRPPGAKN